MYVVQSGVIEMVIGDKVVEVCGPNEAIGFMSMIDEAPRSSTARVKEACEVRSSTSASSASWSTRCRISRSISWVRWRAASAAWDRRCSESWLLALRIGSGERDAVEGSSKRKALPMWPDRRLLDLFKIEHPILLAPMAGAMDFELAVAVAEAGGLGSLPCAMLNRPSKRASRCKISAPARTSRSIWVFSVTRRPSSTTRARRAGASGSSPITRSLASIRRRRSRAACACRSTARSARWSRTRGPAS